MVNGEEGSVRVALRGVEAVIFDLDGLVLDTESTYFAAWRQAAELMGYRLPESFCLSLSGLHYHDIEKCLFAFLGTGFDLDTFNRLSGNCWYRIVGEQGISIKKGFQTLLRFLRQSDIRYGLATNSSLVNALECLEFAGLGQVFDVITARDHVCRGKPSPEIFLKTAECLSVPIGRCMVLEDSTTGINAASASGAFSVYVPSVSPADPHALELSDLYCRDLDDLADLWFGDDLDKIA